MSWGFDSLATDSQLTAHQRQQLGIATSGRVGLLVGGAGVGKTHSVSRLINSVVGRHGTHSIKIVAPTGKAAVRASEAIAIPGVNASTVHSALGGRPNGDGWSFTMNQRNPFVEPFLLCDETSMLDLAIGRAFLEAIPRNGRVLFIGDDYQLPSVDTGNVLRDLIAGGVPTGRLTETHRNAGTIAAIADRVRRGEMWNAPRPAELDPDSGINLCVRPTSPSDLAAVIARILDMAAGDDENPIWDAQVITGTNKTREHLNDLLQSHLNPHGKTAKDLPFRVGDKVIKIRRKMEYDRADTQATAVVMNGEFGEVIHVEPGLFIVRVVGPESRIVKVPQGDMLGWDLGYACTTHKMQGSECAIGIVVIEPTTWRFFDRTWLYTAITRAKRLCFVVGDINSAMHLTRQKHAVEAKTFLAEMIRGEVATA